jgi:hypothetical protein
MCKYFRHGRLWDVSGKNAGKTLDRPGNPNEVQPEEILADHQFGTSISEPSN